MIPEHTLHPGKETTLSPKQARPIPCPPVGHPALQGVEGIEVGVVLLGTPHNKTKYTHKTKNNYCQTPRQSVSSRAETNSTSNDGDSTIRLGGPRGAALSNIFNLWKNIKIKSWKHYLLTIKNNKTTNGCTLLQQLVLHHFLMHLLGRDTLYFPLLFQIQKIRRSAGPTECWIPNT